MMKNSAEEKKENESLKNNNLHLTKEISNLQKAITKLERRLSYFLRDKFGRKSEKISPEDLYFGYLFDGNRQNIPSLQSSVCCVTLEG